MSQVSPDQLVAKLRTQAADKEDPLALLLLDVAEKLEPQQQAVLLCLVTFRNKGLGEEAAGKLAAVGGQMAFALTTLSRIFGEKES